MKLCQVFFLTICTTLLIASSCQKEPVDCCDDNSCQSIYECIDETYFTDTVLKPQAFLDYWYFEKGSWWVYQRMDTDATVYDTVRVIATVRNIYCDFNQGPVCSESALVNMRHSNSFFFRKDSASLSQILGSSTNFNLREDKVSSSGYVHNGFVYDKFFKWPFKIGDKFGESEILDSLAINTPSGKLFNTLHIDVYNAEVWITKDIGFSKIKFDSPKYKDDPSASEWILVDYHVIR